MERPLHPEVEFCVVAPLLESQSQIDSAVSNQQLPDSRCCLNLAAKTFLMSHGHLTHAQKHPQLDFTLNLSRYQSVPLLPSLVRFHCICVPSFYRHFKLVRATVVQHSSKCFECLVTIPVKSAVVVKLIDCVLLTSSDQLSQRFVHLLAGHQL